LDLASASLLNGLAFIGRFVEIRGLPHRLGSTNRQDGEEENTQDAFEDSHRGAA
jgi:hypothetical protein